MRNWIATLGLVLVLLAVQSAFADTINYFTSGTYGSSLSGMPTTPLTTPGSPFSFSFSLSNPVSLSPCLTPPCSDNFTTLTSVTYKSGSLSMTVPGTAVLFFLPGPNVGGGFDIQFTVGGNTYLWEFFGANQLFTGTLSNPVLISGTFPYGTGDFSFNNGGGFLFSPPSGTIVASSTTVPEPGSLILLGTGAVGIAGAMRRKLLSGIRT